VIGPLHNKFWGLTLNVWRFRHRQYEIPTKWKAYRADASGQLWMLDPEFQS